MTTYRHVTCPATTTPYDEFGDSWPVDFDDGQSVNVSDVLAIKPYFGKLVPPAPPRYDLNGSHAIDISDVLALNPFFGMNCSSITSQAPSRIPTKSAYMSTTDSEVLWDMGCYQAIHGLNAGGGAILHFGAPRWIPGSGWGTQLFGSGGAASTTVIREAVKDYLVGFFNCRLPDTPFLFLVVGTSSDDSFGNDYSNHDAVGYSHGQAWASMINEVDDWIKLPPSWGSVMEVQGGIDMEAANYGDVWAQPYVSTGCVEPPCGAIPWTYGFDNVADGVGYIYFGDAGGCSSEPLNLTPPGDQCNGDWTWEHIYYASFGSPSAFVPVPQIYRRDGVNAGQWYALFDYAVDNGDILWIGGSLTQYQACIDATAWNDYECINNELDNLAIQGYYQLWVHFFSYPSPFPQPLGFTTDITWQN